MKKIIVNVLFVIVLLGIMYIPGRYALTCVLHDHDIHNLCDVSSREFTIGDILQGEGDRRQTHEVMIGDLCLYVGEWTR